MSPRFLIDSHVFLWLTDGGDRLSAEAAERLAAPDAQVLLSVASVAEICIKNALGKLPLPHEVETNTLNGFSAALDRMGITSMDITLEHAAGLRDLPRHHGDPFDRLLIVQAVNEGLTLVTHDRMFGLYDGLKVLWT